MLLLLRAAHINRAYNTYHVVVRYMDIDYHKNSIYMYTETTCSIFDVTNKL